MSGGVSNRGGACLCVCRMQYVSVWNISLNNIRRTILGTGHSGYLNVLFILSWLQGGSSTTLILDLSSPRVHAFTDTQLQICTSMSSCIILIILIYCTVLSCHGELRTKDVFICLLVFQTRCACKCLMQRGTASSSVTQGGKTQLNFIALQLAFPFTRCRRT